LTGSGPAIRPEEIRLGNAQDPARSFHNQRSRRSLSAASPADDRDRGV